MQRSFGERWSGHWTAGLIIAHIAALVFGLLGLLIAVPNPHLWSDSEFGARVYSWGMQYAGGSHIIFATAAMLLVGTRYLGLRRTLIFFAIACVVSLGAELTGTMTGFPFGEYRYTSGLGYRILDEVPFTIPLSWFYMGLASYVLAIVLVGTGPGWKRPLASVFLGSILLTIWDLVLDPAMAHESLGVRFWVWDQGGIYFNMPAQNFLGWILTGSIFMGLSRIVWGMEPPLRSGLVRVSFIIYLANLIFAMVISAGVGLWWPVLITLIIGVIPAGVALLAAEGWPGGAATNAQSGDDDTVQRVSRGVMTLGARLLLWRNSSGLCADGLENVPERGPALIVSRHYHHLLDGCALQVTVPRPVHIMVAMDWAQPGQQRRMLETACRMARWPMVIRPDAPGSDRYSSDERARQLRVAFQESVELLASGRLLTVFPEGYPTIDPIEPRKSHDDDFLPFDPGFTSIVRAAERRSGLRIPLVPVGFAYEQASDGRWSIQMRVGVAVYLNTYLSESSLIADLGARVKALSEPEPVVVRADAKQVTETS